MLLIWSVLVGNAISEVPIQNLRLLWMDCFSWRLVADMCLIQRWCSDMHVVALGRQVLAA